jgi:hypothetical protein
LNAYHRRVFAGQVDLSRQFGVGIEGLLEIEAGQDVRLAELSKVANQWCRECKGWPIGARKSNNNNLSFPLKNMKLTCTGASERGSLPRSLTAYT